VYFGAAKLGLSLAFQADQVTAVWPPTGIALAAVLLFGYRVWPGIALGAFVANATAGESVATAVGIAVGNTLETLSGVWLVHRFVAFRTSLDRLRDALAFVVLAGAVSTMISASIGVTSLCVGQVQPWSAYGSLWWLWWLGDASGAVLVTPFLLIWLPQWKSRLSLYSTIEAAALVATVIVVSLILFAGGVSAGLSRPLEFSIFPFMVWAALRFGQRGTTAVTVICSGIAIWGTVHGFGPFVSGSPNENLILLQTFMGVVAVTALLLSATVTERRRTEEALFQSQEKTQRQVLELETLFAERKRAERRRSARLAVTEILAQAATLKEAAPRLLQAVCDSLSWDTGAIWATDPKRQVLRCLEFWPAAWPTFTSFETASRNATFARGVGLPGRVWASGKPAWVSDVVQDLNFPRAAAAQRDGLHGAFCFPIEVGGEILGVIEFYSQQTQVPDPELLEMFITLGGQVGQFMDRKQAEANLQHRLAELDTLLEILPTGVWIGNSDCSEISGNPAAYEIMGLPQGINASMTTSKPEMPAGVRIFANGVEVRPQDAPMQQVARTGKALRNIEHELLFPDGTRKTVYASIAPLFGDDGKVRGVIGSYADFTDRKNAELAVQQANRRKDEFLATLAHELRNPLAPLANALEVLKLAADDREIQAQTLGMMQRQLGQMIRLIDELLDVSRITRNKLQLRKECLELREAIQSALETTRPLIENRGHELTVALPGEPVHVEADPVRLVQIFTNLLNNAAKFTPNGGHIWLTARTENGNVLVAVRDSGIGIAAEHLSGLFEMFSQVTPALERSQGGLGIGLSLVRGLIELHQGTVEARSEGPNQGSEFIVRLPVLPTQSRSPRQESGESKPTAAGPTFRLLVVDDNPDTAASLAMMLRLIGHDVRTAPDGPQAIEAAAAFQPNAILLDIGLPRMNGYEVARQIREQTWGKKLLLVAVTGWGQHEDRQRAFDAGFDYHLTKPVKLATLLDLLATSLI
jgi:signal transduction histidine kinase/integral membrane sensor domain MASE1/CheY-like chemotaxis protein